MTQRVKDWTLKCFQVYLDWIALDMASAAMPPELVETIFDVDIIGYCTVDLEISYFTVDLDRTVGVGVSTQ
jgi:hypothetical protein